MAGMSLSPINTVAMMLETKNKGSVVDLRTSEALILLNHHQLHPAPIDGLTFD
jgi:hypothetical protein